ncbi:hypothetical protein [Amycolatopsis magusensis]|uniref:Secreted protein n=1 Tax=Amycolatopsis magusensis TaxID=882444 RepID=A0ABS4PHN1_9PSEU|nr:hypothetical protein [Amycolatopsis magusensis]MBP2178923.1 hypothetical protein [Amycolatopsis magusensis]MDI5975254.1 hypothetical protein [Amycolatopsis magusensis]
MRRLTLGALTALTLLLTACGADDGGDQVASAGQPATGAPASAAPAGEAGDMGVKFAQCMRENGVDMPDPEPGKGVQLKLDGKIPKEVVDKAQEACRQYSPQANGKANPQLQENARKFAECMRANGVEAFADPDPNQGGIRIDKKQAEDPDFEKAQEACKDLMSLPEGK